MLKKKNAHKAKSAKQTKSCCVRLTKSGSRFRTQSQSPISSCARAFARRAAAAAALLPLTDNRSDWHTQRMSVQVRHESGSTLSWWACSWWRVTRHDDASFPSRCVVLHVKFSSLRWKFKSKEMQIRMWMRLRLRIRMWVWLWIWVRSGLCGTHLIMIHHSAKRGDEGTGTLLLFRCLLERLLRLL